MSNEKEPFCPVPLSTNPSFALSDLDTLLCGTDEPLHPPPIIQESLDSPPLIIEQLNPTPLVLEQLHPPPLIIEPLCPPPLSQESLDPLPLIIKQIYPPSPITKPLHLPPLITEPLHSAPLITEPLHPPPLITEPLPSAPLITEPLHPLPLITEPLQSPPLITEPLRSLPTITEQLHSLPVIIDPLYSQPLITELLHPPPKILEPILTDLVIESCSSVEQLPLTETLSRDFYLPLQSQEIISTECDLALLPIKEEKSSMVWDEWLPGQDMSMTTEVDATQSQCDTTFLDQDVTHILLLPFETSSGEQDASLLITQIPLLPFETSSGEQDASLLMLQTTSTELDIPLLPPESISQKLFISIPHKKTIFKQFERPKLIQKDDMEPSSRMEQLHSLHLTLESTWNVEQTDILLLSPKPTSNVEKQCVQSQPTRTIFSMLNKDLPQQPLGETISDRSYHQGTPHTLVENRTSEGDIDLARDVVFEVMSFRIARRCASERDLRRTADHVRLYLHRLAELRVWFDERVRRMDVSLQRIRNSEERHNMFTADDEIRSIRTMRLEQEHAGRQC